MRSWNGASTPVRAWRRALIALYVATAIAVVVQRGVDVGPIVDGLRVIRGGINPADRVIIDGVQHARPGKPVTPKAGQIVPTPAVPAPPVAPAAASATFAIAP